MAITCQQMCSKTGTAEQLARIPTWNAYDTSEGNIPCR